MFSVYNENVSMSCRTAGGGSKKYPRKRGASKASSRAKKMRYASSGALATVGYRIPSMVERKFYDTFLTANTSPTNIATGPGTYWNDGSTATLSFTWGHIVPLNLIGSGSGVNQRIGRKITIKSAQVRGTLQIRSELAESDLFPDTAARIMLVYDTQTNGAIATSAQIFAPTGASVTAWSPMNLDFRERFRVLADKQYAVVSTYPSNGISIKMYKKMNLETTYNIDTSPGAISQINTGALYLIVVLSNTTDNSTNPLTAYPRLSYHARLRYTDA